MEPRAESADGAEIDRKKIEEERALGFGGERDQLALRRRSHFLVNVFEVGRLAAETGTVVDDLAVDLAGRVVDQGHFRRTSQPVPKSLSSSSSASPTKDASTWPDAPVSRVNISVKITVRSVTAPRNRSLTS